MIELWQIFFFQKPKLPESHVWRYMGTLSSALQYLHSQNILHRDFKPENIMLHSTSELTYDIKLADFGIAKLLNQKSQNQYYARNQSKGTACYMAPEALSVSKGGFKSEDTEYFFRCQNEYSKSLS